MTLTVKRSLSREFRHRILDASAAWEKHSGGVVINALAAWFIGFILFLASVPGELASSGFLSR